MNRFVGRHRLGIAKFSIPAMLAFTALLAIVLTPTNQAGDRKDPPTAPPDEQISDSTDLDGSPNFEAIIAAPSGQNENEPDPGQVLIQYDNGSLTIFEGQQDDDWFGASVAVAGDINVDPNQNFNGDGHADIIVGAPNESPSGYAYVFYGPFAPGQVLHPADADMKFFPPEEATYNFGINVRQVADIDCDGTPDIGVGGVQPIPPGSSGGTIGVAYFISGATGEAIYVAEGTTPSIPGWKSLAMPKAMAMWMQRTLQLFSATWAASIRA